MEKDYRYLIDIAKLNLSTKLSEKIELYDKNRSFELKNKIIELIKDKKEIIQFNEDVIKKYL